jgi:secreted trypsin-like serine protease
MSAVAPEEQSPTVERVPTPSRARISLASAVILLSLLDTRPAVAITHADRPVRNGEAAYVIAIYENPHPGRTKPAGPVCTGSLLTDRIVVTAAHCTDELGPENLSVGLPAAKADPKGPLVPVIALKVHESYRPGDTGARAGINDLALLLLAQPIDGKTVQLPTTAVTKGMVKSKLTVYGYGLDERGRPASALRMALVQDMTEAVRRNPPPYRYDLTNLVPAGGYKPALKGYAGACTGDSGGPLVLQKDGKAYLVGVTSYVFADRDGRCDASFASSFLRVSAKSTWITTTQRKLVAASRSYRLTYQGVDPTGDGTASNHADLTALQTTVTSESVELVATVRPAYGDSELYVDVSFDTDGDRVADLKAFGRQGTVSDGSGEIRCQASFGSDRRTLRVTLPRGCFRGDSMSLVVVANEIARGVAGSDSIGMNDLALPRR